MLAATFLLILTSGLAVAGGWATIVTDDATPPEPKVGETVDYGFTVLQHGVTPAGWEQPSVNLMNIVTGTVIDIPARAFGADGHFVATVTLREAGHWTWLVELRDLVVTTPAAVGVVLEADGSRPVLDVAKAIGGMQAANSQAQRELRDQLAWRTAELQSELTALESREAQLRTRVETLTGERDTLRAELSESAASAATVGAGGLPPLGVISLAVLAGSFAGFAMTWLGRRRDPVEIEASAVGRPAATAQG
jgi:hypothetical protein